MNETEDIHHLHLLSIFHYVVAGILALFSCFPIFHLIIGIAIITGGFDQMDNGDAPPALIGWMFVVFPAIVMLCGWAMAAFIAMAGSRLRRHRGYTFCLVVAGIECMFMPIGTVLGVFTIIVLTRPSVKALFGVFKAA